MKTTNDETEPIRRDRLVVINSMVESHDPEGERVRLQAQHGKVWDTSELRRHFKVLGFSAPYVVVRRKFDGLEGSLEFQHRPRFYFNWVEHE